MKIKTSKHIALEFCEKFQANYPTKRPLYKLMVELENEIDKLVVAKVNDVSTSKELSLNLADVISRFRYQLEVNAGRLAEPLLKQGKQPKEDKDCHKAFLILAHLSEIEDYINGL